MSKQTNCSVKGCVNFGRYCRVHPSGSLTIAEPLERFSKKRAKVHRKQYLPLVKEVLEKHPECKVGSQVCTGKAQGLHHIRGRNGELLTDPRFVIPCCNRCNEFIEKNDAWARANGFKLSKFSKEITSENINEST